MSSNALLWPSQGTKPEERFDKYKWLRLPSQGVGGEGASQLDTMVYEPDGWLNQQWQQRIPVTINAGQVPTTLTDFPLLINDTFPELIGESEAKLRFASIDDIQLEYEIEKFDSITGELVVWIKKPTVNDNDIIYIYFDNPFPGVVDEQNSAAVWSNNFVVVQHMNELSGNILDSTGNGNDMSPMGSPTNISGTIDGAKNFTSNDSYIIPANDSLNTSDITVSIWVKPEDSEVLEVIVAKVVVPFDHDFSILRRLPEDAIHVDLDNNPELGVLTPTLVVGTLYHVAFAIVGTTTLNVYLDGVLTNTQTINPKQTSSNSQLGIGSLTLSFIGDMDEFHMSNDGKSSDWIKTEYNNQRPTGNVFYTTGVVESVPIEFDEMVYEPDNWLNPQSQLRTPFTINVGEVPSTLTDFPLLIEGTIPALIGKSQDELTFASTNNIQLKHEIDEFDTVTGHFIAWIKKPTVSDGDIIYIYYDNPLAVDTQDKNAVWSNNFVVVQHMNELSGNILDSTGNNNDMVPIGSPVNVAGPIGNAKNLPTSGDRYIIPANDSLNTSDITVSAWFNIPLSTINVIASKWDSPFDTDWFFLVGFQQIGVFLANDSIFNVGAVPDGVTHHVAFVIVGATTINIYVNGDLTHTQTITAKQTSSISSLQFGSADGSPLLGIIDEFHMSNDGKSSDWIKTEYNNQRPTGNTFFTVGAEESVPTEFDTMAYEVVA